MTSNNQKAFNLKNVVKEYKDQNFLYKGEIPLLKKINSGQKKMLDIGVGTGRTTHYFAKHFSKYVGIDYAEEMVKAAKEKFKDAKDSTFHHLDASNMSIFEDNEFDFILFSFNGLDCVDFETRKKILQEIKRVGKANAILSYSTHNIFNIPKLFSFRMPRNPINILGEIKRYKTINKINIDANSLIKNEYVFITDGAIDFSIQLYYCNMNFEIKLLKEFGFNPFEFSSLKSGEEYKIDTEWKKIDTPWILINSYINE